MDRSHALPEGDWSHLLKWLDRLPSPIVIHREGEILYANDALINLFRARDLGKIIGRKIFEFIHPDSIEIVKERLAIAASTDTYLPRVEEKLVRVDGEVFYAEVTGVKISFRGRPAIAVFLDDISQRKELESETLKADQLVRTLWDAMPLPMFYKDRQGIYRYVNQPYLRLAGLPAEAILGKTAKECWPDPYGTRFHRKDLEVMAKKKGSREHESLQTKDGRKVSGFLHLTPILDATGEVHGILGVYQETTEVEAAWTSLEEEKERLATLIDASPDIICFKDGEGRWLLANRADLELFRLTDVAYQGKADLELAEEAHPIFRQSFETCYRTDETAWQTGITNRSIEIIPTPEGSSRVYDIYKVPLFNPDGSRKGLVIIGRDITRMREMEEKLRKSEETSRAILEAIPDFIFTLDREGRFLTCHTREKDLLYLPPEDFIGRKVAEVFPAEIAQLFLSHLTEVFETGERTTFSYALPIKGVDRQFECRVVSKGKEEILAIVRDVTREKELEEREREARAELTRLATVIQQASQAMLITDLRGNIVYVNPAFERTTGYTFAEVREKNPQILQSGRHDRKFYKALWDTITTGKTWEGTFVNKRKNGEIYYERAVIFPIRDKDGTITHYAAVKQDITREKTLEEQFLHSQRMEAVGTLAGGIAHDFNNLLGVMTGYCELGLQKIDKDAPGYHEFSAILSAAKKAENLVSQLLAFSRKQVARPKPIDINETVSSLGKMFLRLLPEDITLTLNLTPGLPSIEADPGQIEQVLMNLVINARDAIRAASRKAGEKEIIIETGRAKIDEAFVTTHYGATRGEYVTVIISDTGVGMDEETKARVFEPFFTTKKTGEGTGLGLSTVFGIVEQNGGYITIDSEPQKGATFKIYWRVSKKSPEKNDKGVSSKARPASTSKTILFVEDVVELCEIASEALKSLGYTVFTASNGLEALKLFEEKGEEIDLVVTDLVMPGLNGTELVKRLKDRAPHLRVLYTSGYMKDQFNGEGFLDQDILFLQKPYTLAQLSSMIREALKD